MEVFERNNVTFVSVTQSFNTTNVMGRLTLNVLLSFAQFEREVIGERIRDKVASSRKKGMWMGGFVPLGFDAMDRKLVVNEARGRDSSNDIRTVRQSRFSNETGCSASRRGCPRQAGQARRQGVSLQAAQQPRLYR